MPTKRVPQSVVRSQAPAPLLSGEELRNRVTLVKVETLRLCQHLSDIVPKGARLDQAMNSIRTGVRLAIELAEDRDKMEARHAERA